MLADEPDREAAGKIGLLDSVKRLTATLLSMGQTRLELISNDLEEERAWLTSILLWTLIALLCAALAVVLATLLVVVVFWDSYRLLAINIMIGIFTLAALFSWRMVTTMSNRKPRLFSASIAELAKDRNQLSPDQK